MQRDHACLLYESKTDQARTLLPYHREALEAGDRCIHVLGTQSPEDFLSVMRDGGLDLTEAIEGGSFVLLGATDVYLQNGGFERGSVLTYWTNAEEEARADGYSGLTVSADMDWVLDEMDVLGELNAYEVELNDAFRGRKIRAICCYDRRRFPGRGLAQVFASHPRILLGEEILETGRPGHESSDGSPVGWLEPLLTQLRQSEDAVWEALAFKEKLFEVVPTGIYTCDSEGRITSFNPAAAELWGREPRLNDPDDRFSGAARLLSAEGAPVPRDECWMALSLRSGEPSRAREIILERPDGSRVSALAHAHPIHGEQGRLLGAVGVLVDITSHKQAEEAQARLAAIVQSAEDAVISKDLNGVITSWNRGATVLFGYEADEAIGQPASMLAPPAVEAAEPDILERIRRREPVESFETVRLRKDGSRVDVSLTVSPIIDARGRVVGASKIARDITERRRAEEALRVADRRKDEFLAMLSHELRNPLAPIRSSIEVLRLRERGIPVPGNVVDTLERQVGNLTRLVDDLLDVSRVTMGKIEIRWSDENLNELVQRAVDSARHRFDARRQELFVSLSDSSVWVSGDATRLEQIIVNLLSNASKFTPERGRIEVSVRREGDEAVLYVKDSGKGIAPDLRPHLFEVFTQGEQPLDRAESGLGIGLALAKHLVQLHRGGIRARSFGPNEGSEFVVRLPTIEAPIDLKGEEPPADEGIATATPLRILFVEDFPDAREVAEVVLSTLGHEVLTAPDGATALEKAKDFRPEVAMLDIGLPGMDGYELARRIRRDRELGDVTLIALTGYGEESDRRKAREAGFDHHLVKPVHFLTTVRDLLNRIGDARRA